ncbi:MAG: GTP 3',8-cyclase MoaA [Gemmatimonadales bacterium]|nr:GTP 3',8-cyclase MoaA [Gemmatimonadales bacterium]NIN13383.1 GTP 3',8-cyclase MoaA [Gemmatimonadales bacterium]NIN51386.1 GTP 3',8-cyclase MoaA [Gemmatimonadales bacterium]NIP08850.1 GTP 3',8-cyclase MoaA [Gemmatimonadales bacterium]NIQ99844.1 GTP 3',8-cyclase MoaA [Gemmatimonadales bacterium]
MIDRTTPLSPVLDTFDRRLDSLRVSVTDRCNLRCRYCMPEEEYVWLPRESILSYEEANRLVGVFSSLGVSKVRITGGEPLLRRDLARLIALINGNERIGDLAMTTNGLLLAESADQLKDAGLGRITVSLDTLRPERFRDFARRARLDHVLEGIEALQAAGFQDTKINTVVVRGFNDDEIVDLLEFGRAKRVEVRFIEYMDVGGATQWSWEDVVPRAEILEAVRRSLGEVEALERPVGRGAPAEQFALRDGTVFGIISSTTEPFCRGCGRSRITADGMWLLCLYADTGTDLKKLLRTGLSDDEIAAVIREVWHSRTARGAEERLTAPDRGPLYKVEGLRRDPHREMHTRGG